MFNLIIGFYFGIIFQETINLFFNYSKSNLVGYTIVNIVILLCLVGLYAISKEDGE